MGIIRETAAMSDTERMAVRNSNFQYRENIVYIVESGTSGIWYYRKWSDGTAECWCSYNLTIPINEPFDPSKDYHYYGVIPEQKFPIGLFIESPLTILSVTDDYGNIFGIKRHSKQNTTGAMYAVSPVSSDSDIVYVDIEAKGRWKVESGGSE